MPTDPWFYRTKTRDVKRGHAIQASRPELWPRVAWVIGHFASIVPCGSLVRWTVQTWHFTSQLKTFPPKIFHNCTDLRFHCMLQEKRVCICRQLRPLWSCRTQHICCFLQSRPSQHAVVDVCQTPANEDCRYLHSFIIITDNYCTQQSLH